MEADDIKIFKDSYETHKARKDALEKSIAEKKNNNEIVGDIPTWIFIWNSICSYRYCFEN